MCTFKKKVQINVGPTHDTSDSIQCTMYIISSTPNICVDFVHCVRGNMLQVI